MVDNHDGANDVFRQWRAGTPWPRPESIILEAFLAENGGSQRDLLSALLETSRRYIDGAHSIEELAQLPGSMLDRLSLATRLALEARELDPATKWELVALYLLVANEPGDDMSTWEPVASYWQASDDLATSHVGRQLVQGFARKQADRGLIQSSQSAYQSLFVSLDGSENRGQGDVDFLVEYGNFLLRNLQDYPRECVDVYLSAIETYAELISGYDEELERLLVNSFCMFRDIGDYDCAVLALTRVLDEPACAFREETRTAEFYRELVALHRRAGNFLEAARTCSEMLAYVEEAHGDLSSESCNAMLLLADIHVELGNFRKAATLRAWAALNQKRGVVRTKFIDSCEGADLALTALFQGDARSAESMLGGILDDCRRKAGASSAAYILFALYRVQALFALSRWRRAERELIKVIKILGQAELDEIERLDLDLFLMIVIEVSQARHIDEERGHSPRDFSWVVEEASAWIARQNLLVRAWLTFVAWFPKVMVFTVSRWLFWLAGEPDFIGRVIPWRLPLRNRSRALIGGYVGVPREEREAIAQVLDVYHDAWLGLCLRIGADREIPGVLAGIQGRETALDIARSTGSLFAPDDRISFQSIILEARDNLTGLWGAGKPVLDPAGGSPGKRLELSFPDMSGPALGPLLGAGEGALLIFEIVENDGSKAVICNVQWKYGIAETFVGEDLGELMRLVGNLDPGFASGRGVRGFRGAAPAGLAEGAGPTQHVDTPMEKAQELLRSFWTGIDRRFQPTHLYVATHQDTHLLPLNCAGNSNFAVSYFPGMMFLFSELNRRKASPVPIEPVLSVHCDPAEETRFPIPFVRAEAAMIRQVWGEAKVSLAGQGAASAAFESPEAQANTLVFAAHGEELPGTPPQSIIWLDRKGGSYIDASNVLTATQRPTTVIASACVAGRVREDGLGEPLGLVSSFFINGARFILAPLQPIPDLYTPLVMGLFHRAWKIDGSPRRAWERACRQALSGDWPGGFEDEVVAAYGPVMEAMLEKAAEDPAYLETILNAGWKLHRDARLFPDEFIAAHCATKSQRKLIVDAGLEQVLQERHEPSEGLRFICAWTVPFGS